MVEREDDEIGDTDICRNCENSEMGKPIEECSV